MGPSYVPAVPRVQGDLAGTTPGSMPVWRAAEVAFLNDRPASVRTQLACAAPSGLDADGDLQRL
ncbi:hypothetical protein WME75_43295 [Sorangium sp. So ce1014]|uniref:hypothetical protein n=1 Tax=Sorangium sp. So ce1014 TaxID=3133326 RepID=UPI003F5E4436